MAAPGGLTELDPDGVAAWDDWVGKVTMAVDPPPALALADAARASELRVPDWPAVPARIRACLGRERADRLCDAQDRSGDVGRRRLQEDYAEWRLVRDSEGPVRFELTTELSDYWVILARKAPQIAVDLVAGFAREPVSPPELFGGHDPHGPNSTEEDRMRALKTALLGGDRPNDGPGPYNNGRKAITCLSRGDNSLGALLSLAAAAAVPRLVVDAESGEPRFPSASEAIPSLRPRSAQDCRNSDPVIVERLVRLATEGRSIRLDDPVGIYIAGVQSHDLLTPDDEPVPADWFKLSRPEPAPADELPRSQRLDFAVPDVGFRLGHLRARRTGLPISHGAQIAELVELAVYVRVSGRSEILVDPPLRAAGQIAPCPERIDCDQVRQIAEELEGGDG